ncbi:MAG TPA: site-2 protease family protein [Candidatus Omnitrophica bacterium]|nr:site-2 protease family protein [Candidatus Omnitrophota bacterium]
MEAYNSQVDKLTLLVQKHLSGAQYVRRGDFLSFEFHQILTDFEILRKEFENEGFYPFLRKEKGKNICILVRKKEIEPAKKSLLIVLFFLTFLTTTWAGYFYSFGLVKEGYIQNIWVGAFSFSFGLLLVLGSHEFGHKFISIKNEVPANGPYFIPVPPFILPLGTLGAIIKIRSPMPDKNAQVRLGVAGPLTGTFFSIIVLLIGLKLSFPVETVQMEEEALLISFGESLLFKILTFITLKVPADTNLFLHPLAFAGWVGLFVTFLNLIPVGQLDGGHIARAVLGARNHHRLSFFTCGFMCMFGLLGLVSLEQLIPGFEALPIWPGWLFWGILGFFLSSTGNPGAMNELQPLGKQEKILALVTAIIFLLTFMPVPIKMGL